MCLYPLSAFWSAEIGSSGKRRLIFDHKASHSGIPISVPCYQCIECRLGRAKTWSVRMMHEKRMHPDSVGSFVTLTYSDQYLPLLQGPLIAKRPTLVLSDLQKFMKRLRKKFGAGVRFYGCGEYGEMTDRPHYHVVLFNVEFADRKLYSKNARGEPIYTSAELSRLWPFGFACFGAVTHESCNYVAKYCVKKITGKGSAAYYAGRLPEFPVFSRKPGIGHAYYMKYGHEIYAHDSVIVNGVPVPPPRYYDELYAMVDRMFMAELKEARRRRSLARLKADGRSRYSDIKHQRAKTIEVVKRAALSQKRSVL